LIVDAICSGVSESAEILLTGRNLGPDATTLSKVQPFEVTKPTTGLLGRSMCLSVQEVLLYRMYQRQKVTVTTTGMMVVEEQTGEMV